MLSLDDLKRIDAYAHEQLFQAFKRRLASMHLQLPPAELEIAFINHVDGFCALSVDSSRIIWYEDPVVEMVQRWDVSTGKWVKHSTRQ